jgi:isobutyryl-CoA dehydrogenase
MPKAIIRMGINFKRRMNTFALSQETIQFQELAKAFADKEMKPNMSVWDQNEVWPMETFQKAAQLGFGGIYCSQEFGGAGLTRLDASVIFEAMSTGCVSTTVIFRIKYRHLYPYIIW